MMKTLLVNPSSNYFPGSHGGIYPPFGLWLMGTALKKHSVEVEIIDLNVHKITLSEVAEKAKGADFIGVSCTLDNFKETEKAVKAIREASPNAKIIGGGPAVSVMPDFYLSNIQFDQVVAGEGEVVILEIINGCSDKIIKSQKPANLFCPDYSLMRIEDYWQEPVYGLRYPTASTLASRSCPFSCAFCASCYLGSYREKAIEAVEEEVKIIKEKGAKSLVFLDPTFGINLERTLELCLMLARYQLEWLCQTRVDVISNQKLKAMADAGCKRIYMGLESSSQSILDGNRKGTTVEKNLEAIQMVRSFGITPCAFLLLGLPGDTDETIDCTFEMIKKLGIRITPSTLYPVPGTPIFEIAKTKGLTFEKLVKEIVPAINDSKRTKGVNLSDASEGKVIETVMKIWRHNDELEG